MNNEQIYILTEHNEVKESSSIYCGDDKGAPQLIKQVYRTDEDGKVVLAKCYHDYNITYTWNGYSSCTATATCQYDSTHTVTEESRADDMGDYYQVDFDNPMFETQTKDKERDSYSISYTYNSDYITLRSYNPDYAYEGATVTIRFSSKTYYNTVTVSYDNDYFGDTVYCDDGSYTSYSFTMPSSDITVSIYHYEPDVPEHTHNWKWTYNNTHHWQYCTGCDAEQNKEEHDPQETDYQRGTCATPEKTSYKCTICGWTTTVTGDKDPTEHTGNTYEEIKNYHFWESEPSNKGTKIIYCKDCGKQISTEWFYSHTPIYPDPDKWNHNDKGHYQCCQSSKCDWETLTPVKDQAHSYVWYPNDEEIEGSHIEICSTCGRQRGSGYHADSGYDYIYRDCGKHINKCKTCGSTYYLQLDFHEVDETGKCKYCKEFPIHSYKILCIDDKEHQQQCDKCGKVVPNTIGKHEIVELEKNDMGTEYGCKWCDYTYFIEKVE